MSPVPRASLRTVVLALAAVATLACAPGLEVTRLRPSRFNLGTTRRVAVLQVNAGPQMQPRVLAELQEQIVNRHFFTLINAIDRGVTIHVTTAGGAVDVSTAKAAVNADVYLNASALDGDYQVNQRQETEYDHGRKYYVTKYVPEAKVTINFQVVKADGTVVVLRDYRGEAEGGEYAAGQGPNESQGELMTRAVRSAVSRFLADITPQQVTEKIVLDDDDPALKPGVKLATGGDLAGAEQSFDQVLKTNPNNPGAIYDLGVLLETRGDFDHAAADYQQAFRLNPKSMYRDALNDLNRRLGESKALNQQI